MAFTKPIISTPNSWVELATVRYCGQDVGVAPEFDACWSTVIAAVDAHAAFGDAPHNGWVQQCRLESGHTGLHGSDAGAKLIDSRRVWLQWVDGQSGHRLIELAPCPGTDGADSACCLFADHGGPHRFVPTSSTLRFGTHYEAHSTVSRNGTRRSGTVATAPGTAASPQPSPETPLVSVPESAQEAGTARRSRHLNESTTADEQDDSVGGWATSAHRADTPARTGRAANRIPDAEPTVDEALLAVAEALAELARAIGHRDGTSVFVR